MSVSVDTIVAPATPAGTAALAIVRVSGPACRELAEGALGGEPLLPRQASHRDYSGQQGQLLDDVIATFFPGPNSYTGEDLLELSTHGNPLVVHRVVADLLQRGCRMAEPGEFTKRAFLHGRLDLAQAEAVIDVIHARSEEALAMAQQQLRGSLGRHLHALTEALVLIVAQIEAYIDFPEEDLPAEDLGRLRAQTEEVLRGTERLLATQRYGDLLRQGIRTVIVGETNVGKSTLLNALVGEDRALVSDQPGTTRDFLREPIMIGGHLLQLVDTAGLNEAAGALEQLGIDKTMEQAAAADLLLLVVDAQRPPPVLPPALLDRLQQAEVVVIANKWDAMPPDARPPEVVPGRATLPVSARQRTGLDLVTSAIGEWLQTFQPSGGEQRLAINARHADALTRAQAALREASVRLGTEEPAELIAAEYRAALAALGEIVGPIDHERVLDQLFASFCIGK